MVMSSPSVMVSASPLWMKWPSSFFHWVNSQVRGESRSISRLRKGETAVATRSGISFARLLGVTSPKISTTMVSTMVDTVAPRWGSSRRVKSTVPMEAAAMFTMLLPMRMVESSLSYCSDMASTRAAEGSPSSARLFRRIWFREENAVSEAEKKAEKATRITSATKRVRLPSSIIKGNHTQLSVINLLPQSASQTAPSKREPFGRCCQSASLHEGGGIAQR